MGEAKEENKIEDSSIKENTSIPEQPKPAFAGLPIDDTADSWMDDDVGPIVDSEDETEEAKGENKIEDSSIKENTSIPEQPKPAFAGLPIDDTADSWMNDDVGMIIESDEEEEVKKEEPQKSTKNVKASINTDKEKEVTSKNSNETFNPKTDSKP